MMWLPLLRPEGRSPSNGVEARQRTCCGCCVRCWRAAAAERGVGRWPGATMVVTIDGCGSIGCHYFCCCVLCFCRTTEGVGRKDHVRLRRSEEKAVVAGSSGGRWPECSVGGGEKGSERRRWPGSCDAGDGKQGARFLSHHSRRSHWRSWQRRCGGDRATEKQRQRWRRSRRL